MRNPSPCSGRLEQEPVLPGMTAVMKDRHPIAMLGEDLEDLLETGVGPDDQLAQALSFGRLQDGLKQPQLLRQVAEIAMPLLVSLANARTITGKSGILSSLDTCHTLPETRAQALHLCSDQAQSAASSPTHPFPLGS